ncbi:MAG TPA: N-acetyltransferase, partial [Burkholderiales bacterium]|nr:N-acetyltransferase [Burkholderiales bacterium]
MPRIREETTADFDGVRALLNDAFGGNAEARLVDRLRASNRITLSLVAEEGGRVLGHVLFSPIGIDTGSGDEKSAIA